MTKQEREALLYQPKHGRDRLSPADEAAMQTYCEAYKAFLDRSKTERECVVSAVELAEQAAEDADEEDDFEEDDADE